MPVAETAPAKPAVILELPPTPAETPLQPTLRPTTAVATKPAPASAPVLNPEQQKALEELAPEPP